MKAVTQNLKTGKLQVQELPPPILRPDGVLVRVRRSLISLGTERAVIALANKGPIGKAKDRPDLFRKVLNKAKQEGYWSTYKVVRNLMTTPIPLGYSCAGDVIEVGAGATDFHVGDRVACAGLNHANHAEIDYIPRNLAARMPDAVSYDDGCFVTVGTIALHGVRLGEIALGDRVVVLGLGLVGQITAQLARITSCRRTRWRARSPSSPAVSARTRCCCAPRRSPTSRCAWPPPSPASAAGSSSSATSAWRSSGGRSSRRS
jgi:threonine dehydrogenase-like Zn-dependent dehydrogenase